MQEISFVTRDGIRFTKVGNLINVTFMIGGYKKMGDEEMFYFTDLIEVSDESKVEFEGRVRQLVREVESFEGKVL